MSAWVRALLVVLSGWLYPGDLPAGDVDGFARVIERVARESGSDPVEMAAELSVLFLTEGHGDPRAEGRDGFGRSYGGWQVHETTLRQYADRDERLVFLSDDELKYGAWANCSLAADLVVESHRVCRRNPPEERLAWYASGGPTCSVPEGLEASRVRMGLVRRLLDEHPYFWNPDPVWVDRSPPTFEKRSTF